jgi:hypothetical protein
MQFSRQTWQGIALVLALVGLTWGACGLLLNAIPTEPSENVLDPAGTGFWITRGCCLGPAFVILFLAYLALAAGRRPDHTLHGSELVTALGVAFGLLPTLLGLAIIIRPASSDPVATRTVFALICLLPGLFIIALSGVFWALTARQR